MGRYFEELSVGDVFVTPRRTITEADIGQFAGLTGDYNPVHVDEIFASQTMFGGRIAHGPMLIGMAFGLLSRRDVIDGTVLALKGIEWTFMEPVRAGDTVHVRAEVIESRPSARHADRGTTTLRFEILDQDDVVAQVGRATMIMMRSPQAGP